MAEFVADDVILHSTGQLHYLGTELNHVAFVAVSPAAFEMANASIKHSGSFLFKSDVGAEVASLLCINTTAAAAFSCFSAI
jgi:hypothetical protein